RDRLPSGAARARCGPSQQQVHHRTPLRITLWLHQGYRTLEAALRAAHLTCTAVPLLVRKWDDLAAEQTVRMDRLEITVKYVAYVEVQVRPEAILVLPILGVRDLRRTVSRVLACECGQACEEQTFHHVHACIAVIAVEATLPMR